MIDVEHFKDLMAEISAITAIGQPAFVTVTTAAETLDQAQFLGINMGIMILHHAAQQREVYIGEITEIELVKQ